MKSDSDSDDGRVHFVRYFVHYRTKKLMDAHAYGLKCWPIRVAKRR